jgi:hypothetical protein
VALKVYDFPGREATRLVNEWKEAGNYEVIWKVSGLASGVYFYRVSVRDVESGVANEEIPSLVVMK